MARKHRNRGHHFAKSLAALVVASVGLFGLSDHGAHADDEFNAGYNWDASVTLYGWLLSMNGQATINRNTVDLDVPFKTVLENLDGGIMAETAIHWGNLGFFLNGVYGRDTADTTFAVGPRPVQLDADVRLTFLDFGVSWRFEPMTIGQVENGFEPTVTFEPYIGARYTDIDLKMKVGRFSLQERYEFTDPLIGLRSEWDIAERWRFVLLGDLGGFGVGSDFSWHVIGTGGYRFGLFDARDATVFFGYRALGQDYSRGDGTTLDGWDTVTHGPLLGLNVAF